MKRVEITTVAELLRAIKYAKEVVVLPRFGLTETWMKITKAEATAWVKMVLPAEETPEGFEMFTGKFGTLDEHGVLYMG